jgi:hypothetical protein
LGSVSQVKALAERLSACPQVTKFDRGEEREAWTLVHAFADLEQSCRTFTEVQLPRLASRRLDASELPDLLLEIGEELRHMLYHIRDPQFYRYLDAGPQA